MHSSSTQPCPLYTLYKHSFIHPSSSSVALACLARFVPGVQRLADAGRHVAHRSGRELHARAVPLASDPRSVPDEAGHAETAGAHAGGACGVGQIRAVAVTGRVRGVPDEASVAEACILAVEGAIGVRNSEAGQIAALGLIAPQEATDAEACVKSVVPGGPADGLTGEDALLDLVPNVLVVAEALAAVGRPVGVRLARTVPDAARAVPHPLRDAEAGLSPVAPVGVADVLAAEDALLLLVPEVAGTAVAGGGVEVVRGVGDGRAVQAADPVPEEVAGLAAAGGGVDRPRGEGGAAVDIAARESCSRRSWAGTGRPSGLS